MVSPWKRALSVVLTSLLAALGLAFIFPIIFGPLVVGYYNHARPAMHHVGPRR